MQPLQILDPPSVEPVSLGEVQTYLKVEDDADSARLMALIRTAREACELFCSLALIERKVRQRVTLMGKRHYFIGSPVQSLDAISAFVGSDETVLNPSDYEIVYAAGRSFIEVPDVPIGRLIQADYVVGLGANWNAVPEAIRQGILRLVAHQYEHRSDPSVAALPHAVTALWQPYRVVRL